MERHIAALSAEQRKLGVRVTDVFNMGRANGESVQVLPWLPLHRVRPSWIRDVILYLAAAWKLRSLGTPLPLVVHAHGHWSAALMARLLGAYLGASAVVLSVHGPVARRAKRWQAALGKRTQCFATGAADLEFLSEVSGRPAMQMISAPDDVFFTKVTQEDVTADIIAVGNLFPVKNYTLLIKLANRLPHRNFAIYGDGPDRKRLEAEVEALGVRNLVMHGTVDASTLRKAFGGALVLVNCSFLEGSPTSALEGMACGVPPILAPSNDFNGLLEGGRAGVCLKSWDLDELEAAVESVLTNDDARLAMGAAAKRVALRHRWSAKAEFLTEHMRELVRQRSLS